MNKKGEIAMKTLQFTKYKLVILQFHWILHLSLDSIGQTITSLMKYYFTIIYAWAEYLNQLKWAFAIKSKIINLHDEIWNRNLHVLWNDNDLYDAIYIISMCNNMCGTQ